MRLAALPLLLLLGPAPLAAQTAADTELAEDPDRPLVQAHCTACHSARLITQNRGSRETWLEMIRWMQDSQGLWAFDLATEQRILDYLEKHYAPQAVFRRAPLPPELMPDPPQDTDITK